MTKNKKKSAATTKTTTAKREDETIPSMESAVIASDERKLLPEENTSPDGKAKVAGSAPVKTVAKQKKANLSLIESDLMEAVKNIEAEMAIVKDVVVITAATPKLAKNASAAVWRKIGELRKDGIIDSLPKVETKIS